MAHIFVWECAGTPFEKVPYGDRLVERLKQAGHSPRLIQYTELAPHDIGEISGNCIANIWTGGSISSCDPSMQPWKQVLRKQIEASQSGGPKLIGICLGAQLMAEAYAGQPTIRESPHGIEVGLNRVETVGWHKQGAAPPQQFSACQFHYHEIDPGFINLAGVQHLLKNRHTVVQGFQIGPGAFGYQFHPEFSDTDSLDICQYNKSLISRMRKTTKPDIEAPVSDNNMFDPFKVLVLDVVSGA